MSRKRGFTLLEMIVATTLMGIAVVGLLAGITGATRNAARLRDYDRVIQLARLRMNDLLADPRLPRSTVLQGSFPPALAGGLDSGWRAQVTTAEMSPNPAAGEFALDRIELEIWWMAGDKRRTFPLESYRRRILRAEDLTPGVFQMKRQAGVTLMELMIAVTLLSLLSVGLLFALRIGLTAYSKTQTRLMDNRRVAGAQRILEQQLEGMMPVVAPCGAGPQGGGTNAAFFQGEPQTMRLVSTFSLQQAWRGQPQILEVFLIPGADGRGVRLVVNEISYSSPAKAGLLCVTPSPGNRHFLPVMAGPGSFVLADKLAFCRFSYLTHQMNAADAPVWVTTWSMPTWPRAVRVEMEPLEPDPGRLQPITITAPIRLLRSPEIPYGDY